MENLLPLGGMPSIGEVMSSTGPMVKCVLLRATATAAAAAQQGTNEHTIIQHPHNDDDDDNDKDDEQQQQVHDQELIEEILVDTTPRKSMVAQILGGPFTFLGQYEEEGIVLMIRRRDDGVVHNKYDNDIDNNNNNDNSEKKQKPIITTPPSLLPMNRHRLQPPFHKAKVRGDILLMRVAEIQEEEEEDINTTLDGHGCDRNDDDKKIARDSSFEPLTTTTITTTTSMTTTPPVNNNMLLSNEEFFLDYTKEEYLKFSTRTDIVAHEEWDKDNNSSDDCDDEVESNSEDDEADEDDECKDSEDEDYDNDDDDSEDSDDEDDEDGDENNGTHQVGMMNMLLGHLLHSFRDKNGRGPNSLELLEIRKALADKLGVDVPPVDEEACDWESPLTGKKKHDRKVILAETMIETEETIPPSRQCQKCTNDNNDVDKVKVEETNDFNNSGQDKDLTNLKQPTQGMSNDSSMQPQQKRMKLDERNGISGDGDMGAST